MLKQNLNLTLDDLIGIAKHRGIRGYKRMSERRLISSTNESKPVNEKNFDSARMEKIEKDFNELRDRLSQPKLKWLNKIFIE